MAQVVALKSFNYTVNGVTSRAQPGDVFKDTDFSDTEYAAILAAGDAIGNALKDYTSPDPGLVAAVAEALRIRAAGGNSEGAAETVMLDGAALDSASGYSTGTATLVAGSAIVTVPPPPDGAFPVPTGSKVYGTITTKTGKTSQLFAARISNTQIQLSTHLTPGYDPLLESAGTAGTLAAGTVDVVLANAVGDKLSAALVTPGGTPGELSAVRVDAGHVRVNSWVDPGGIQALDTSDVKAYNFGQSANETSLVRWSVIRPLWVIETSRARAAGSPRAGPAARASPPVSPTHWVSGWSTNAHRLNRTLPRTRRVRRSWLPVRWWVA